MVKPPIYTIYGRNIIIIIFFVQPLNANNILFMMMS